MPKKPRRLKLKRPSTMVWVLVVMILSILGGSYLISWNVATTAEREAKNSVGESLQELAFQMSDKADRGLDERYRDMIALVSSPSLRNASTTTASKQQTVDIIGKAYPQYSFVAITDKNGKVAASKDGLLIGANVSARPWFAEAAKAKDGEIIVKDVHTALLLAKLLPPNANNEPLRFIDLAGPLYDSNNQLLGVVGTHLSFNWIDAIRTELVKPHEQRGKVEIVLLANNNQMLLGPKTLDNSKPIELAASKDASVGKQGWTVEKWPDSDEQFITGYFGSQGFGQYKGLGWKVLVRQPVSIGYAAAQREAQNIRLGGLALGAVMTVIATAVIWNILRRERKLEQAQTNFVSLASHQLRTPATAVKQNLGMVIEGYATKKADVDKFLHKAYEINETQLDIIDDILNIARLETGKMKLVTEKTEIGSLVQSVVDEQLHSTKSGQSVSYDKPKDAINLTIDPTKIKMSVGNFLSNAIKYTPENGKITVSITDEGSMIAINVKDDGVGIDQKDIAKLFVKFGRVENPLSSRVEGTGLGLYLVKEIARLHNGSVEVKSEVGKGSQFIIRLPKE